MKIHRLESDSPIKIQKIIFKKLLKKKIKHQKSQVLAFNQINIPLKNIPLLTESILMPFKIAVVFKKVASPGIERQR